MHLLLCRAEGDVWSGVQARADSALAVIVLFVSVVFCGAAQQHFPW